MTETKRPDQSLKETALPSSELRPDFRKIYEAECAYVYQTLRRLGVRESDIEDVAHETFLTVYKRLDDYDTARPLRPWLFGFCFRFASDHRKRANVRREIAVADVEQGDGGAAADAAEARALVHRALDAIELDRRAVFVAHEIDGWSIPEVAESLGIPINTAYSRLRLARGEFAAAVERLEAIPLRKAVRA